jgi:outer membrane protein assembly factor BamD (BamD/ComL family)
MSFPMRIPLISCSALLFFPLSLAVGQPQPKIPNNGPKATVVHETNLYVGSDTNSSRLAEISPGREIVVLEKNGPWLRVFANTDAEISHAQDAPVFGNQAAQTPISGWIEDKGVVNGETPKGDLVLFGVGASEEVAAGQPHAPPSAAQAARLLYQRVVELFPNSPLAPEAAWRTADIRWQLQKADIFTLPSAREKEAYLREQIDETEMRKIQKMYPNSRYADLAAWDMLDNKVCGDWQGSPKCPEKEAEMYEKYAQDRPNSPKAPQALYEAVYRRAVLTDMYGADNDDKKAAEAKAKAMSIADFLESKYPTSDYTARAAGLVYRLQAGIPIYGVNQE